MKRIIALLGWLVAALVAVAFAYTSAQAYFNRPSRLTVYVQNIPWQTVTLYHGTASTGKPVTTFELGEPCIYTSLRYGMFTVHVPRQDEPDIWVTFLHADAGRVRVRDLVLLPASEQGKVEARLYTPANDACKSMIFDPSTTSEAKPADFFDRSASTRDVTP
jgi:hypothetical protein